MAVLWLDGCDTYTAVADAAARYAGSNTAGMSVLTTSGRFGGGCVQPGSLNAAQPSYMGPVVIPHTGTNAVIIGGAIYPASTTGPVLVLWNSTGGSTGTELYLEYIGGFFRLWRGYGNTLLATASAAVTSNLWHHFEAKAICNDTTGSFELRINGTTLINYSGDTRQTTTGTAGFDRVYFCSYANGAISYGAWDDIYILDTTGSVANNWLNDCRINTLAPTSDSITMFTRSTGATNYGCVDEGRHNSDTDYVETALGAGTVDHYGFADLSASVTAVYGVQSIAWARKTDATARTMRCQVTSAATTSSGTSTSLLTTYAPMTATFTLDPATSAQWTPSAVNALVSGFQVQS